jgi:ribosome maturation factor RimP
MRRFFGVGERFAPAFLFGMVQVGESRSGAVREVGAMAKAIPEVARELEARVAELGFDLVDVEWAGSSRRPIVRIRIDRMSSDEGAISVADCVQVSRGLEPWLDEIEGLPDRYVLEVSSPGVDRPLHRRRDFERFVGEQVAVKGDDALAGRARRLEGELMGLVEDAEGRELVRVQLPGGEVVEIPRDEITGAHLVFRWS